MENLIARVATAADISPDGDFRLLGQASEPQAGGIRFTLRRRHTPATADLILHGTRTDRYEFKAVVGAAVEVDVVNLATPAPISTNLITPAPIPVIVAGS